LEELSRLIAVNLIGYFLCAQVFGDRMRQAGQGLLSTPPQLPCDFHKASAPPRAPVKAGVVMLSQQWRPLGIRSNVISPGLVRTPMSEASYQTPSASENVGMLPC
jgi:NAD(P)-dependent dehydrogenase (short-subunit alcohol dehydrogenase family)